MFLKNVLAIIVMTTSLSLSARVVPELVHKAFEHVSLPSEKIILPNGLTVILSEDHSTPFIAVNVWYQVGAVNEKMNHTGWAHLFEHLMFEGSRHVKASDHFRFLENAGAFEVNASTSFDRTNYYQTLPKNQLELALALEASRMFWLVIDQKKLDEQRAVVRREREQRLETTPYGNVTHKLWQTMFTKRHPYYGQVIGSHEDLESARLVDVQDFYDRFYGPTNASLTLVGDFNKAEALSLINKYFGTLPKTAKVFPPSLPSVVLKKEEIIEEQEKVGKLPLIRVSYVTPALYKPGDAEMDILAYILAGGEHSRLNKAITRDKQLASSVAAFQQSFGQTSVFSIDAMLNPGVNENDVRREIDAVLTTLASKPVEETEIERAKNSILTQQLFGLQNLGGYGGRAELLQTYNRFAHQPDFLKEDILRYRKIDGKALTMAAKKYLPVRKGRKILIAKPISVPVANKGN